MRKKNKLFFILSSVLILSFSCQKEKKQSNKFVTQDVHNFYDMLSQIENATSLNDTLKILNESYLQKASIGLKDYLENENSSNNRDIKQEYLKIIRSFPKYFQSQKPLLSDIENQLYEYDNYFQKIKDVYPDAKFQPTYFSIGFFNTQGQMVYPKTIFVGLEASIRNEKTDYSEFPENYSWLVDETSTIKDLGYLVVHENLHTLQEIKQNENSILDQAITEGAAVFLTTYFCGKESLVGIAGINRDMIEYAEINNMEIWKEFTTDLKNPKNFSKWFWNSETKYPYSMGYYMGYMICKSFFENQKDKENAIKVLIEINEPNLIFENSEYYKFSQ
jgi:hypothetical protein